MAVSLKNHPVGNNSSSLWRPEKHSNLKTVEQAENVAHKMNVRLIRPEIKDCSIELKQTIIDCKKCEDAMFVVAMDC